MSKPANTAPVELQAATLPEAYARIVDHVARHPGKRISPLSLTIANDGVDAMVGTDGTLRATLDDLLQKRGDLDIETVAFTIFPKQFFDVADSRAEFFGDYKDAFPRLQALDARNSRGLYFERMTMWPGAPCDGNQLEWIIQQYCARRGVRASMLQAAIFDPAKDHTASAQLGFPCLQHVSFVAEQGELVLNAFYATQQLLRKAYGNYLGLIRLGGFMADEMGLSFSRLNVFVGIAKLDEIGKTTEAFAPVLSAGRSLLNTLQSA